MSEVNHENNSVLYQEYLKDKIDMLEKKIVILEKIAKMYDEDIMISEEYFTLVAQIEEINYFIQLTNKDEK